MSTQEKYFLNQLRSHHCQLPPSDDFVYMKEVNKIKKLFLMSENSLKSYLKAKSLSGIYYEKRRQMRTTRILIVHPYSEFRKYWGFWICFVDFVAVFMYPFGCAFNGPFVVKCLFLYKKSFHAFYTALYTISIIQIVCLTDTVANFFFGYVDSTTNEVVIQPVRTARHYVCTYFFLDLLSSLPLNFILVTMKGVRAYSKLSQMPAFIVCTFPLIKLARMRCLYQNFHSIYGYFSSSYNVYKIIAGLVLYMLTVHWAGCIIVFIPQIIYYNDFFLGKNDASTSWLKQTDLMKKNLFDQYMEAIYRSLTCMMGIAFNVRSLNIEDKILVTIFGIVGKLYWILLLVLFLQMLSTVRTGRVRYQEIMDQVEQYMSQKKFPKKLRNRIRMYYIYMFRGEYIGEKRILQLLSYHLQQEILMKMHSKLIDKIGLFNGLNRTLLFDIVSCLKPEIYLANDVIYKVGDVSHYMYFISFGSVALYSQQGNEIQHFDDGEHFGEISLIMNTKRLGTAIAIETTELYCLSFQDFTEKIKPSPTYLKIHNLAFERIMMHEDIIRKLTDIFPKKRWRNIKMNKIDEDDEDDEDKETRDESPK